MMSGNNMQYVIELNGNHYRCTEDKLEQIEGLKDVRGDVWFVSDFGEAVSRAVTIETPFKYADIMVRKSLQETGDFDEPLSIVTHWKKKRDANTTDIFFTAFSARLFHLLIDRTKAVEDNVLVFPVYSILHKVIKNMRHPQPVAVIFQHDRFAEIVIGTRDKIFFAERCVAFDDSEEQISTLWNMLGTEIQNAETENLIKVDKVLFLTWIDTKTLPESFEETQGVLCPMEEETLAFEGETYSISFLKAFRMMSGYESVSGPMEKTSYYSEKILPFINIFLLLAIVLLFSGFFWYGHRADQIEETLQEKIAMASDFQTKAGISEVPYKETFDFIKELDRYQKTPSFKQALEDITEALPGQMTADVLKADYDANTMRIEIFVKTEALFDTAYKGYQSFLSTMEQKGYDVEKHKFDTSIQDSQFLVVFNKKAK